jgi:hypothetical protein
VKRRRVAIVVVVVAIVGVCWFGLRECNCQRRNAAFGRHIETIKQDARAQIKLGTRKSDDARFFTEHNIAFNIADSLASGFIEASGCAPFGCGSDAAVINVRVTLDDTGAATKEPQVVGIYTNCL